MKGIWGRVEDEGVVKDGGEMGDGVMKREGEGGVGIGGRTLGVFDLKSEGGGVGVFKGYDVWKGLEMKGMEGRGMKMMGMVMMVGGGDVCGEGWEIVRLMRCWMIESDERIKG